MESVFHIRRTRIAFAAALAVLGAIVVSSCYTSPDPMRMEVARSPRGIEARFALSDRSRGATELLAVTDTGLVVLRGGRVVFVRYARIQSARFENFGSLALDGAELDRKTRARLAYLSRFPFGLSDAVLAELLRSTGQQAPDTINARRR